VICSKAVAVCSKAVECNICQDWSHIKCCGYISNKKYDSIVQQDLELNFTCSKYTFLELPILCETSVDDFSDSNYFTNTLPSHTNTDHFQSFLQKGLHFIHMNCRSLLPTCFT
jgi:hypothetical protein